MCVSKGVKGGTCMERQATGGNLSMLSVFFYFNNFNLIKETVSNLHVLEIRLLSKARNDF